MLSLTRTGGDIPAINLHLNNLGVLFAMLASLLQCLSLTLPPGINKALPSR